jgi:hypothetical protein
MSLDSRDKRMSMVGVMKPNVRLLKNPSGAVDATSRAMLIFLYSGIGLIPPPVFNPYWALKANQVFGVTAPPTPED